jgi:hypothetical protein
VNQTTAITGVNNLAEQFREKAQLSKVRREAAGTTSAQAEQLETSRRPVELVEVFLCRQLKDGNEVSRCSNRQPLLGVTAVAVRS